MTDAVSMIFVRRAMSWLGQNRPCHDQILSLAGIEPQQLMDPDMRVSTPAFSIVWQAVSAELEDEFFGLDARRMKPGSFALLCRGLAQESSFDVALERCLKSFELFLDDTGGSLLVEAERAFIRVKSSRNGGDRHVHATELFLTMVHGIMCWLAGRPVPLIHLALNFPKPGYAYEYGSLFSHSVSYDEEHTEVTFDARWLKMPVIQCAATLDNFLQSMPCSVITKFRNASSLSLNIRQRLRSIPARCWPDISELAQLMNMATSTLQRRLEAEGSSYSLIKTELRRDVAIDMLRSTTKPISIIACEVGYQEISTFYRAFRHWTGRAPGAYRRGPGMQADAFGAIRSAVGSTQAERIGRSHH
ncbi:MAG: AraC family transcriptional regulator [Burkholderiaceae bacterium]|nr:AraC family transcriptional regulator [Burkholderiaceae bacterium]